MVKSIYRRPGADIILKGEKGMFSLEDQEKAKRSGDKGRGGNPELTGTMYPPT